MNNSKNQPLAPVLSLSDCSCGHALADHRIVLIGSDSRDPVQQRWCEGCSCVDYEPVGADEQLTSGRPLREQSVRPDEITVRALWECLLFSGADVSQYTHETRTKEGYETGFREWMRSGSVEEVVTSVRELRKDYDDAGG